MTVATIDAPGACFRTGVSGINTAGQIVGDFEDVGDKWHGYVTTPTQ